MLLPPTGRPPPKGAAVRFRRMRKTLGATSRNGQRISRLKHRWEKCEGSPQASPGSTPHLLPRCQGASQAPNLSLLFRPVSVGHSKFCCCGHGALTLSVPDMHARLTRVFCHRCTRSRLLMSTPASPDLFFPSSSTRSTQCSPDVEEISLL